MATHVSIQKQVTSVGWLIITINQSSQDLVKNTSNVHVYGYLKNGRDVRVQHQASDIKRYISGDGSYTPRDMSVDIAAGDTSGFIDHVFTVRHDVAGNRTVNFTVGYGVTNMTTFGDNQSVTASLTLDRIPKAPTAPGQPQFSNEGLSTLTVTWDPPQDDGGGQIANYRLHEYKDAIFNRGEFGLTGSIAGNTVTDTLDAFSTAMEGSRPMQALKVFNGRTGTPAGTGDILDFPTTITDEIQACIDRNMTAYVCYRPWYNSTLTTFDSTAGNGSNGDHGGTQADWIALKASLQAYKDAGLTKCKVILWQKVEYTLAEVLGGTAVQYHSLLAYMKSAVDAVYPNALFHESSGGYPARFKSWLPGPPNRPSALVTAAGLSFYADHYVFNNVRLEDYADMCDTSGIVFSGCPEMGVASQDANPPTITQCLNYMQDIVDTATSRRSVKMMYSWFMDDSGNTHNLIPGYADGTDGTGPDMLHSDLTHSFEGLETLYDLVAGGTVSGTHVDIDGNSTTRNLTNLSPGTTYTFTVTAVSTAKDNNGISPMSVPNEITMVAGGWIRNAGKWVKVIPYIRVDGVWKQAVPYVRSGGTWKKTS